MQGKNGWRGAWLAVLAAGMDRLSKQAALNLPTGGRWLIPGALRLRLTANRGIAFSMLSGQRALVAVLTVLLLGGLTAWLLVRPNLPRLMRAGLWLVVGGGLGNLYDRIRTGAVIDFIEPVCVRFAVFNVADACICMGAALAMLGAIAAEAKEHPNGKSL